MIKMDDQYTLDPEKDLMPALMEICGFTPISALKFYLENKGCECERCLPALMDIMIGKWKVDPVDLKEKIEPMLTCGAQRETWWNIYWKAAIDNSNSAPKE